MKALILNNLKDNNYWELKSFVVGPVVGPGLRTSEPSQILPYMDGRGGAYSLGNQAGTKLMMEGRKEGSVKMMASESSKTDAEVESF